MSQTATPPQKTRTRKGRRCFVLDGDWTFYTRMLRAFENKPGHRLAYDRGRLEIMSPSLIHDDGSRFLGDMVVVLAMEFELTLKHGGGVTMRKRKKEKGIEADSSYWIANAYRMGGGKNLDLSIHPPPDLSLEIDVSRSSLNRFGIYAAIGVPEIWRLDSDELHFYLLGEDNKYHESAASRSFPLVSPVDLLPFIQEAAKASDVLPVLRRFREWVRQRLAK